MVRRTPNYGELSIGLTAPGSLPERHSSPMKNSAYSAILCARKDLLLGAACLLGLFANSFLTAIAQNLQGGSLDTNFNANLRAHGCAYAVARQTNGFLVIGGSFTELNGASRQNLARTDSSGTVDTGFAPAVNGAVEAIVLQPDGKLLIGGSFTEVNGASASHLARLTSAGEVDSSFQLGTGADGEVSGIVVQPDGKLLVAGRFASFQGGAHAGFVRLLANGSLDSTFRHGLAAGSQVYAVALQPDSRILIGGWFTRVGGINKWHIARLNANGTVDTSFTANAGPNDWINAIKVQPDGHIVVAGSICEINLISRNQLARLNADGSVDLSFAPGARLNGGVNCLGLDGLGRILAGGTFDDANGRPCRGIARFLPDGRLDQSLVMSPGVNGKIWSLIPSEGDSWVAGGWFDDVNGLACASVVRFATDGTPDPSLALSTSLTPEVWCVAVQPDGRLLIGGRFSQVDGVRRNGIAQLRANGQLAPGFDPGAGINGAVYCLSQDASGLLWAGGWFNLADGHQQHSVACLSSDGTVVASYKPFDWLDYVYALLPLPDGSLFAGGDFYDVGARFSYIARLKASGALDLNLPLGWGANDRVRALVRLGDGRVLMGGSFNGVAGAWHKGIARLNADGSLDSTFNLDLGDNSEVLSLKSCSGSKVLVGGHFNAYNRSGLLRLNSDGSVDSTFNAGSGPDGWIQSLAVQTNAQIVAAGQFTHFNGASARMVVRLKTDGSVDQNFQAPSDIDAAAHAVAVQPNGGIVIGGGFTLVAGRPCTGLVRLNSGTQ